jgi:hypothetical protein
LNYGSILLTPIKAQGDHILDIPTLPRDLSRAYEHYTALAVEASKVDFSRISASLRYADPLPSPYELSTLLGAITHLVSRVAEGRPDLSGLTVLQEACDFSHDLCASVHPKPEASDGLIVWHPMDREDEFTDFDNDADDELPLKIEGIERPETVEAP